MHIGIRIPGAVIKVIQGATLTKLFPFPGMGKMLIDSVKASLYGSWSSFSLVYRSLLTLR